MKIPIRWLKEYVSFKEDAQVLADKLTMTGTAIEAVEGKGDEAVLHAEITTNRPDCLSLLGIATEVAALYQTTVKTPVVSDPSKPEKKLSLEIEIQDAVGCPGYTARCFSDAKINSAPEWMTKNLSLMGQPSINNVVDITNYCLFESGQPLHAFDYDKIRGHKIVVRKARKGESIIGINNIKYELDPDILVIADAECPIAIAGVMGGKETEITENTQNIVLESARFQASVVRSASRKLKISTDSSHRFERYVDVNQLVKTSNRATQLIQEFSQASITSDLLVKGTVEAVETRSVSLTQQTLNRILGETISMNEAVDLLKSVGIEIESADEGQLKAVVGSERPDLEIEADLAEEVVRLRGFDRIPTHIPVTRHVYDEAVEKSDSDYKKILSLKKSLASQGFWEAVTFSLVSSELLEKVNFPDDTKKIRIANPISKEQEWLRPTHLPVMLDVAAHNLNRQEKSLQIFDIGSRFYNEVEEQVLALMVTGYSEYNWESKREASFSYLQGVVENVFGRLGKMVGSWSEGEFEFDADDYTSRILDGRGRVLASVTKVSDKVLAKWKIVQPVYFAQISIELALELPNQRKQFNDLSKSPIVKRDIAFLVDKNITVEAIQQAIKKSAGEDLCGVTLFDQYQGKGIPKEKRSLAFNLQYQKLNQTYTDDEIVRLQENVIRALEKSFSIELRK